MRREQATRKCQRCKAEKLKSAFYGTATICKLCNTADVRERAWKRIYKRDGFDGLMNLVDYHLSLSQQALAYLRKLEERRRNRGAVMTDCELILGPAEAMHFLTDAMQHVLNMDEDWETLGYPAYELLKGCREAIHRECFPGSYGRNYGYGKG